MSKKMLILSLMFICCSMYGASQSNAVHFDREVAKCFPPKTPAEHRRLYAAFLLDRDALKARYPQLVNRASPEDISIAPHRMLDYMDENKLTSLDDATTRVLLHIARSNNNIAKCNNKS